ncbi:4-hydroxy-tetrahydrodipicolinate reductase [Bacillus atrophaeus]|uniref:4-hydroxy-tetrahydrodipicolinate reductase n=1 Tax=Bacillus atrophaeus TaxID=1452 RepID=UPI0022807174|nr:4-hydroxy-tetrahydrodipicolinate reductase [Bacillus atrophaeus]MCY8484647.1 4-hydroxy-tetrahydrodipicolinate reductase [Bacillus atrophaeus]MCY8498955.1 4-hydroxy-tetrahydrodipicolinate reductase [Bacillus atrophaeus]MCY8811336.1 4-hydroxy-tetrahydrodipicolinate reductase [Bacillus atrophaeus]MCY8819910.1 4-hydroxy-tetrahydrodipicolinate reductase [Bacillus atrophaeus]MCY8828890.1 4-hydroxy-tetrahydrodipicolinate reductase [Bacillus atrophaeus]
MPNETIKVVIAGPRGRMGQEAVKLAESTPHFELVGAVDHTYNQKKLSEVMSSDSEALIYTDITQCFQETQPAVLIDLTTPEIGKVHTKVALEHGVRPVVGTTGFTERDLEDLKTLTEDKGIGAIIAPNFALGAVLMMKFSQMAANYFEDVEIIELHHDQKLDAPSGTALKTAEMISAVRSDKQQGHPDEKEILPGARGAEQNGIRLHSVRLPGLIAHQEVMFGMDGQSLKIRHDSYNRASFMSGVKLAVEQVMKIDQLVYGLENIID